MLTPPGWSHTLLMLALMLDSADAMPVRLGEPRLRAGDGPLLRGDRLRLERPPEFTAGWKLSSLEPVWPWRRSRCVRHIDAGLFGRPLRASAFADCRCYDPALGDSKVEQLLPSIVEGLRLT